MFIKQISVFLENKKGSLHKLTKLLGEAKIDLLALSIADSEHFGIVRLIVREKDIDPALKLIRDSNYAAKVNNVICANVPHRPLGLCEILGLLEEEEVSVEYLYSFMLKNGDDAYITLRLSDNEKGNEILTKNGIELVDQQTVDALQ